MTDTATVRGVPGRGRRVSTLRSRLGLGAWPFLIYALMFLAIPTVLALSSGFRDNNGGWTLSNFDALSSPAILKSIGSSVWLSVVTAVIAAVVGALVCYALLGVRQDGFLARAVNSASSVLAQFGGVMLAFAFIATIGIQGTLTVFLKNSLGVDIYADGVWLYELQGLILPYLYFQIPLMVVVFLPAMQALKAEWGEANLTLGGTRLTFWRRIGIPVLLPSFAGSTLLLFANAFSSYATAATLINQGSPIVPLQIRLALSSETLLTRANVAGVLALAMAVIMAVAMVLYALIQRRAGRWQR